MSDENTPKTSSGAIAAIIAALPSEVRGILSMMLLFFTFFAMMYALTSMPTYFKNLASSANSKEYCWELKEARGAAFKFNKCTGEAVQLEVKQPGAAVAATPPPKSP